MSSIRLSDIKIVSLHGQLTFDEMKGSLERLPKTNRWVQMGDSLPWTEYEYARSHEGSKSS